MKKLNKLVELASKATPGKWWIDSHGHSMVSFTGNEMEIVFVTKPDAMAVSKRHDDTGNLSHWRNDNDATFIAAANPTAILAIAEAFRALEQRAEAAEAKLAELTKQKPYGYVAESPCSSGYGGMMHEFSIDRRDAEHDANQAEGFVIELFTRAAPATDLADLVPELELLKSGLYGCRIDMSIQTPDWAAGFNACRAEILRRIEEAK